MTSNEEFVDFLLKKNIQQAVTKLNFSNSIRQYPDRRRSCTVNLFFKNRVNGEKIKRSWIFYSESTGKMFCIYCKLCAKNSGQFSRDGFDDWKHSERIGEHETSKDHCQAAYAFAKRSEELRTIHSELQIQIVKEGNYWRQILKRILSVIRFLSSRGLPLRGQNEHLGNSHNGNYLGALELLSEYDPFLRTHIEQKANKGKGAVSYLSSTIADEFVAIIAAEVKTTMLEAIRRSKYFSLIVDSTPDVSHIDQLTVCARYVDDVGLAIERFLGFLANTGHKGREMQFEVVDFLKDIEIVITDCRGQSYDNAPNMSGIYQGLQALIKEICPLAEYVPCSPHSLNLTLQHAAENIPEVARFFLFVQNIYVFFSASTRRWDILLDHLKSDLVEKKEVNAQERLLVPKKLSGTRWSARDDSCRALKAGYKSFVSALKDIFENKNEKKVSYTPSLFEENFSKQEKTFYSLPQVVQIEAESLYDDFFKLETAILLEFWSTVLHRVNVVSKSLQTSWIDLDISIGLYKSLVGYIKDMRTDEMFNVFVDRAKTLISSCPEWETKNPELSYNCYGKRTRKRNTRYDIGNSSETVFDDSKKFRVGLFYGSLDIMSSDLVQQVNAYQTVLAPFTFLFKLEEISTREISQDALILINRYAGDLDQDLVNECVQFKHLMIDVNAAYEKDKQQEEQNEIAGIKSDRKLKFVSKPSRMLQYLKKHQLEATFPNIDVALRIFECMAVANTTGERSFSALKRVKNALRSTIGQEKLNDLSTLFIENDLLEKINGDEVINKFIEMKCRKCFINKM